MIATNEMGYTFGKQRLHESATVGRYTPGPGFQTLDSAIHGIKHYLADKYLGNQLRYPLDRFLSGG